MSFTETYKVGNKSFTTVGNVDERTKLILRLRERLVNRWLKEIGCANAEEASLADIMKFRERPEWIDPIMHGEKP